MECAQPVELDSYLESHKIEHEAQTLADHTSNSLKEIKAIQNTQL